HAEAWKRSPATTFAVFPQGAAKPEGIAIDKKGNVYVTAFHVGSKEPGQIIVFDSSGRLLRKVRVAGSSPLLLGLDFHPTTGKLLVIDFGGKKVLRVNSFSGAATVFTTIPGEKAAGPNVLTFDSAGNVYISDSFQGVIWRSDKNGNGVAAGVPDMWVKDDLLKTSGVPPFGANGLAFNNSGDTLFVANTGNDTVVKIPVDASRNAGKPEVFVNSIHGADGVIVDEADNLWVAANQANEIVVLDPTGRVIAKLGDFGGIAPDGAPIGLLFPASLIRGGEFIYVTNLALDLRLFGLPQTLDGQWAAAVKTYTIAKIRAVIPPVPGL
ncbi:MAG: SMP-30/gluconolactonase/LRE family protein, partial [SAR324 cluster bacterium]|nr:SMP-30/gluconolactonase/LRE family protein [SAR324 cluster bacterium]